MFSQRLDDGRDAIDLVSDRAGAPLRLLALDG